MPNTPKKEEAEWRDVTDEDRQRMRQMWDELFGKRLLERFRKLQEGEQK